MGSGDRAASPLTSASSPASGCPGSLVTNVLLNDHFIAFLVMFCRAERHFPGAAAPAAQTGINDSLGLGDVLHLFKNESLLPVPAPPLSLPSHFRTSHISICFKPHPL